MQTITIDFDRCADVNATDRETGAVCHPLEASCSVPDSGGKTSQAMILTVTGDHKPKSYRISITERGAVQATRLD